MHCLKAQNTWLRITLEESSSPSSIELDVLYLTILPGRKCWVDPYRQITVWFILTSKCNFECFLFSCPCLFVCHRQYNQSVEECLQSRFWFRYKHFFFTKWIILWAITDKSNLTWSCDISEVIQMWIPFVFFISHLVCILLGLVPQVFCISYVY